MKMMPWETITWGQYIDRSELAEFGIGGAEHEIVRFGSSPYRAGQDRTHVECRCGKQYSGQTQGSAFSSFDGHVRREAAKAGR